MDDMELLLKGCCRSSDRLSAESERFGGFVSNPYICGSINTILSCLSVFTQNRRYWIMTTMTLHITNSGIIDKIQQFVAELSGVEITDHRILENMGVGSRKN